MKHILGGVSLVALLMAVAGLWYYHAHKSQDWDWGKNLSKESRAVHVMYWVGVSGVVLLVVSGLVAGWRMRRGSGAVSEDA